MAATLGQLIRERRMDLDLTQEQLAARVGEGVRQSEISRLERNRITLPRRQRMEQIAVALDIPLGVLLAGSGWAGAETIIPEPAPQPAATVPNVASEPDEVVQTDAPAYVESWPNPEPAYAQPRLHDAQPHLYDAIVRAETLIGESQSIYTQAQTTILRARESVKRRQDFRS